MTGLYFIKSLHVLTALLSIGGFVIRGYWRLTDSPRLKRKWVRIVPHVNDTLLLATGLWMAWQLAQYPFVQPWLTAKIIGLIVYIGFGLTLMRFAQRRPSQFAAYVLAIVTFIYIVSVALTRTVIPVA
jgi:uncharacterized membrane protein SirB2